MAKNLTGEQKAAILLRAIGEEAAAQVMKQLDPKEIKRLGSFMNGTAQISRDEEDAVISDFRTASASGEVQFQGKEFIKTVLVKALGPEKAARIIESMTRKSYPGLEALKWVDVKTLVQMLKVEHAQTVAVVLAHLESDQAGQVLAGLPESMRGDGGRNGRGLLGRRAGPGADHRHGTKESRHDRRCREAMAQESP